MRAGSGDENWVCVRTGTLVPHVAAWSQGCLQNQSWNQALAVGAAVALVLHCSQSLCTLNHLHNNEPGLSPASPALDELLCPYASCWGVLGPLSMDPSPSMGCGRSPV